MTLICRLFHWMGAPAVCWDEPTQSYKCRWPNCGRMWQRRITPEPPSQGLWWFGRHPFKREP